MTRWLTVHPRRVGLAYQVPYVDRLHDGAPPEALPPTRPVVLSVSPGQIVWAPAARALVYEIWRRTTGTLYEALGAVMNTQTSWESPTIVPGAFYMVRAKNAQGWSQFSLPIWLEGGET